jgi:predicted lipoprotein with Yx(FWY)xxD motif
MTKRTIGLLVAVLLVVAACGGDETSDTTTPAADATTIEGDSAPATTSTEAPAEEEPTTTAAESASTGAEAMDGIHVAESDLGEILVDPEGFTLYIFTADTEGESTCYDACATLWPPIPADTPLSPELDQSIFGSTTRTDNMEQLTVNGMPLYLYTPDTSPGDVTGQGFNGVWFVVEGDGTIIEAAADGIVIDYGY